MATDMDIDADPFLKLLTDALRAGPGSPEWHQAVARLRESGNADADEYRLLITAREHLEDGKEYRSVRAGPGFTQKLMKGIDEAASEKRPRGVPIATVVTIVALALIAGLFGLVIWLVYPRAAEPARATVDDLVRVHSDLLSEVINARFEGLGAPAGVPSGWHAIGLLPLANSSRGLHLAESNGTTLPASAGGGMVCDTPIPADEPFAAEIELHLEKPHTSSALFEFFVTTDTRFSPDHGTSTKDLVWLLQEGQQKVMRNGEEQVSKPRPEPAGSSAEPVRVRILMNRDSAIVETIDGDSKRIWDGAHNLPALPRYVGVRFLRSNAKAHDPAAVLVVRVMKK